MLIPRLISSIVVLPTVIILTWLGEIYFASLIGITVGIATYELSIMLRKRNLIAYPIASGILSSSYIVLAYILSIEGNPSIVISLPPTPDLGTTPVIVGLVILALNVAFDGYSSG